MTKYLVEVLLSYEKDSKFSQSKDKSAFYHPPEHPVKAIDLLIYSTMYQNSIVKMEC